MQKSVTRIYIYQYLRKLKRTVIMNNINILMHNI